MATGDEATCLFCAIAAGEAAAHVVHADSVAVVFLDSRPLFPGHCLVIPRPHRETLGHLAAGEVGPLFERVQRVGVAVESGMEAAGTFVAMNNRVSQSVAHLHVHVVPRRFKDGLRGFFWPRQRYDTDEEAAAVAERIRAQLGGR